MIKIRLTRLGKHKNPFYRIVAIDSRSKRDGGYLALLGTYEPFSGKCTFNSEEIINYLNHGAQPSDTILNLLKKHGIYKQYLMQLNTKEKPAIKKPAHKRPGSKKLKEKKATKKTKKAAKKAAAPSPQVAEPAKKE